MNETWEDRAGNDGHLPRIEVHLMPEYTRKCLSISLRRTRRRASKLLAELLEALPQPKPDIERMRHLAEGVRFESEMAREIACALADMEAGSDLGLGLAF